MSCVLHSVYLRNWLVCYWLLSSQFASVIHKDLSSCPISLSVLSQFGLNKLYSNTDCHLMSSIYFHLHSFEMYLLSFTTCSFKMFIHGLCWWYSRWVSACQCRRHRFNPWSGKIPHAEEQLKPICYTYWTHTREPMSHSFWAWVPGTCVLQQEKPLQWEAHAWQRREAPAATREGPSAATKIACNQK